MSYRPRHSNAVVVLPVGLALDALEYVRRTSGPGDKSPIRANNWDFLYALQSAVENARPDLEAKP